MIAYRFLFAIVLSTCCVSQAFSAESFEILTASNHTLTGRLQSWTAEKLRVTNENGQTQTLPSEQVVWLRAGNRRPQSVNGGSLVLLANGDRLRGNVVGIDELSVRMKWSVFSKLPDLEIPFETVRAVLTEIPRLAKPRRRIIAAALKPHASQDVIRLKNGDGLTGILLGMTDGEYRLDRSGQELQVPTQDVQAVLLDDELVSFPKSEDPRILLTLADGSWITLTRWELIAGREIRGHAACGVDLTIPLGDVISARIFGGNGVWLTELEPAEYTQTPYLATRWELRTNRNVLDGFLQHDGREFPIGLGQHSKSAVTYRLDKRFRRFRTTIGLDDVAHGRGMAVFLVHVDGRERFRSESHTGRRAPESIEVDVTNADTLTLIVEFGPRGDVRDYANWIDPVLLP